MEINLDKPKEFYFANRRVVNTLAIMVICIYGFMRIWVWGYGNDLANKNTVRLAGGCGYVQMLYLASGMDADKSTETYAEYVLSGTGSWQLDLRSRPITRWVTKHAIAYSARKECLRM